jgi:1-aminocyclopropane-1-carboxylate synthase
LALDPYDSEHTAHNQAPGSAYHHATAGWFRVTFTVARGNLDVSTARRFSKQRLLKVGLQKIEDLLDLKPTQA